MKKCRVSPMYGKDQFKNLTFYCDFCDKEMGTKEDRECTAKREKCKKCGEDIGSSDWSVGECLNCARKS